MENKSLYQITVEQAELFNKIEELDGELTPEILEQLQLNAENFEAKARGYIWMIKKAESENNTINAEIERLQRIEKRNDKLIDRLKESMKFALETFGESKKVDTFTLSLRSSKQVEVYDMELLDAEYITTKTTATANKKAIKEAIESGVMVTGATIKENHNLQIK
jgi:nucleotidyltransferase/DNA polymerase involved in DNA repair